MMTIARWQPWQEMETLRRQMDQMLNELAPARQALTRQATWMPAIELNSTDDAFTVRAQLPGIDAKDLDVQVGRNAVSISGEHQFEDKREENGYFRSEFRYGSFHRVIPLPGAVQNDRVQAEFKDGILTLTLPRLQAVKPSVVKVNLMESVGAEPAIAPAEETIAPVAEQPAEPVAKPAPSIDQPEPDLTGDAWQN